MNSPTPKQVMSVSNAESNSESTRLSQLADCVRAKFLLEHHAPPTPCPFKPDPIAKRLSTPQESSRLLAKVVQCPLYYRESTAGFCNASSSSASASASASGSASASSSGPGYIVQARKFASIAGIDQITRNVTGLSSGDYIARRRTALTTTTTTTSAFIPVFFRTNSSTTTSSGGPLYVCPPTKTAQDPGVPFAPPVRCYLN